MQVLSVTIFLLLLITVELHPLGSTTVDEGPVKSEFGNKLSKDQKQ